MVLNQVGGVRGRVPSYHPVAPHRSYLPVVIELHKPLLRFPVLVEFHGQINSKWGPFVVKNPQGDQERYEGHIMSCVEVQLSARRKESTVLHLRTLEARTLSASFE